MYLGGALYSVALEQSSGIHLVPCEHQYRNRSKWMLHRAVLERGHKSRFSHVADMMDDSVSGLHVQGTLVSSELPRAGSMGFKGAPDLALGRLIGRGSFGRVYKGAPSAP